MRILIIRFSSFGDIFQALEAAKHLSNSNRCEYIDWLVRDDFSELLKDQESIRLVHSLKRTATVLHLIAMAWRLSDKYDHVFDAHSNLRSLIVRSVVRIRWLILRAFDLSSPWRSIVVRPKERIRRFLFFKFRLPTLPSPYRGSESYLRPIRKWIPDLEFGFSDVAWRVPQLTSSQILSEFKTWRMKRPDSTLIALAPSAAWPNKRWPVERWRQLISTWMLSSPESRFLLLGGPEDIFLNTIENEFGFEHIFNAVGRTSILESAALIGEADAVVANDTGLLHVADRLQIPSVAIIGPTAFGYTTSPVARVAEIPRTSLKCKPCSKDGRDRCTNAVPLKCLVDITPEQVIRELHAAFDCASQLKVLG